MGMRAEELMINDWIAIDQPDRYAGAIGQIKSLSHHQEQDATYFHVFIQGKFGYLLKEVCSDDIRPIPLTSEILEKNGFKPYIPEGHLETVYACQDVSKAVADELYALWPYQDGSFYLLLRVDGKDMVRKDVHYVHQLQHALQLCEIKKEIEL